MPHRLIAVVELVCAAVGAAWLLTLGIGARESGTLLFVLAAVVGIGLGVQGVRSWRKGRDSSGSVRTAAQPQAARPAPRPVPRLSPDGEGELARVVAVLARAGVFAPQVPDPAQLAESVADGGEPVTAAAVLAAIDEAAYYHPGFRMEEYRAALAFHESHGEQLVETLHDQIDDIIGLAGGDLDDVRATVDLAEPDANGAIPTHIRLGTDLRYRGDIKYLSTYLHVALARMLRDRGTGRRLAWLWCDQGVWLTTLPDGGVAQLNAELGAAAEDGWAWVDEDEPMAAGDLRINTGTAE